MSVFITIVLLIVGVTLLGIALFPTILSFRNTLFRLYISVRPKKVLRLLSDWYPTLDIQVTEGASLALVPVPWTVVEAIRYANEQSQRIAACLVPTVNAKTGLVSANVLHRQAVAQFRNSDSFDKLESEKTLAEIRKLQLPPASSGDSPAVNPPDVQKAVAEGFRDILRQHLFDRPFESNLLAMTRYIKEPLELRRVGEQIRDQILIERNGGEDDRIRIDNIINQVIQRRFNVGEEE